MFQWENSGPTPLDLVSPLAQGVQQGAQAAYRQAQIKLDAAKTQQMQQALGLQQKEQDFRQAQWDSMGGMRSAQLSMATANADTATQQAQTMAHGQPILNDFATKLDTMSDPDEINNMSVPARLTSQQQQQATELLAQKRNTQAASIAYDTASKQHLNNVALTSKAVNYGLDPTDFTTTDGTTDYAAMGDAVTQKETDMSNAAEDRKVKGQQAIDTNKQQAIGDRQQDYLDTKSTLDAQVGKMSDIDKMAYRSAQTQYNGAVSAQSKLLPGQDDSSYIQAKNEATGVLQSLKGKYGAPNPAATADISMPGATAAASTPRTATNPATGQKMIFQNGNWVPAN